MATYYQTPWGAQAISADADDPFDVPADWTEITAGAFAALAETINADPAGHVAANAAAALAAKKAVYDNLKASRHTDDWTEATIQAVSGYTPKVGA